MSQNTIRATLVLAIDLEWRVHERHRADATQLDSVTAQLVSLLGRYRIPATWAVADPARSAATDVVQAASAQHEIAVLGDPTWVGRGAGRARFARELARRVEGGRTAGVAIDTLALRSAALERELEVDLAVKHGLSMLSTVEGDSSPSAVQRPRYVRFGLWQLPVTATLTHSGSWLRASGGQLARRAIRSAISSGSVVQVLIDGPSLVAAGTRGPSSIERTLRLAARLRDRGVLQVTTLGLLGRSLAHRPKSAPAHSILRAA